MSITSFVHAPAFVRIGLHRPSRTLLDGEVGMVGAYRPYLWCIAAAAIVYFWTNGAGGYNQLLVGTAAAYTVTAAGYNLILGYSGQMHFGQVGFMAVGAYTYAILKEHNVNTVLAVLAAALLTALVGLVLGSMVVRSAHLYLAVITFAFTFSVAVLAQVWSITNGDSGLSVSLNGTNFYLVGIIAAGLSLILVDRVSRSRFGRALLMIRADQEAASAFGVKVARVKITVFSLGAAMGGLGGVLLLSSLGFVTPQNFSSALAQDLLLMIIIGGLGTVYAVAVGAGAIVAIDQALSSYLSAEPIIYGVILIVVLIVIPNGVASLPTVIEDVLTAPRRIQSLLRSHTRRWRSDPT